MITGKRLFTVLLVLFIFVTYLSPQEKTGTFPELKGPYLGQKPPGMTPEKFPSESVRSFLPSKWHGVPTFSPDGMEMFWVNMGENFEIYSSKIVNGKWSEAFRPSLSENSDENNPVCSSDGKKMYFLSFRSGGYIFEVSRTDNRWSVPVKLNIKIPESLGKGWSFSISNNKTVYLELWENRKPKVYRSTFNNNEYKKPEKVRLYSDSDNIEMAPYIDPDEKFLIFSSMLNDGHGEFDLYIAFQKPDGSWTAPKNMGNKINSSGGEVSAFVSFDSKYLFFLRGADVYWVNAKIIEELKPVDMK
ncbi:hypothetical protein ACFL4T_05240 [candidate division KSB1 bacterium]